MIFAVQGPPSDAVPTSMYVSIQHALDRGRVDLNATVPDDVATNYGRQRPMPRLPAGLVVVEKRRYLQAYLREQARAPIHYIRIRAEELPAFVWEWFAEDEDVVFVWRDPATGKELHRQVVPVWRQQMRRP